MQPRLQLCIGNGGPVLPPLGLYAQVNSGMRSPDLEKRGRHELVYSPKLLSLCQKTPGTRGAAQFANALG